jgi:hypothetical protein
MTLIFKKHFELSKSDLREIISIKKIYWNYNTKEQKKWLADNLYKNDLHVLMKKSSLLVGYMNLVNIDVLINQRPISFIGVGNVCALNQGQGYGTKLISEVQQYLIINDFPGLLFCQQRLISFYQKNNWKLINRDFILQNLGENVHVMTFNFEKEIFQFEYRDRRF